MDMDIVQLVETIVHSFYIQIHEYKCHIQNVFVIQLSSPRFIHLTMRFILNEMALSHIIIAIKCHDIYRPYILCRLQV